LSPPGAPRGLASPEYVVFRLKPGSPISSEYLLAYLQSSSGLREIIRNAQGTIRSRLYFDNLSQIRVPVPAVTEGWQEALAHLNELASLVRELPITADHAIGSLVDALFWWQDVAAEDLAVEANEDVLEPVVGAAKP
jgi:type I restriction enzyme M protein